MQQKGQRVLLMDADLGLSNVNVVMGIVPQYNLYHVLKGERQLHEVVFKTKYGVDIVAGASGFSELADLSGEERFRFIEQLDYLEHYDQIVLDTGAGISKNVTTFLHAADKIIIVTTPEPTSVTDAYGIIKVLVAENKNLDLQIVINRCESAMEGRKVSDRMIGIVKRYLASDITNLGLIYQDKLVKKSLFHRTPFIVLDPKSKSSISVSSIGNKLLDIPETKAGHVSNSFKHLIEKWFGEK